MSIRTQKVKWAGLCVAAALVAAVVPSVKADEQELQERIKQLENRLNELESKNAQQMSVPSAEMPAKTLEFLGQTEISGFVSASYIYDFRQTGSGGANGTIPGRGFDQNNNSFTINKFKLALEKPINQTGDNWDAGYRADLILGQDAPLTHSSGIFGGPNSNQNIDLEQAFVDFNIPIGNGLKVIFGKTVTLMGVEVIEEVANPNWSVGNQFLYVENFTQTGLQLAYKWTDKLDTQFVVFNGWDALPDNNRSMSYMGRVGLAITDKTTFSVLGYGGKEQANDNANWREGVSGILSTKCSDKLTTWVQVDYGHEDNAPQADLSTGTPTIFKNAEWFATGLWVTYDLTEKFGIATRGDYLHDGRGARTPFTNGAPVTTPATFTVAPHDLYSWTLTLNCKPVANLQIRPEFRWDHAAENDTFAGKDNQFTLGCGVAYLY